MGAGGQQKFSRGFKGTVPSALAEMAKFWFPMPDVSC